jgi:hypothetical protein
MCRQSGFDFLPSPLVGEGLGVRGISLRKNKIPLTLTLSHQGRGKQRNHLFGRNALTTASCVVRYGPSIRSTQ